MLVFFRSLLSLPVVTLQALARAAYGLGMATINFISGPVLAYLKAASFYTALQLQKLAVLVPIALKVAWGLISTLATGVRTVASFFAPAVKLFAPIARFLAPLAGVAPVLLNIVQGVLILTAVPFVAAAAAASIAAAYTLVARATSNAIGLVMKFFLAEEDDQGEPYPSPLTALRFLVGKMSEQAAREDISTIRKIFSIPVIASAAVVTVPLAVLVRVYKFAVPETFGALKDAFRASGDAAISAWTTTLDLPPFAIMLKAFFGDRVRTTQESINAVQRLVIGRLSRDVSYNDYRIRGLETTLNGGHRFQGGNREEVPGLVAKVNNLSDRAVDVQLVGQRVGALERQFSLLDRNQQSQREVVRKTIKVLGLAKDNDDSTVLADLQAKARGLDKSLQTLENTQKEVLGAFQEFSAADNNNFRRRVQNEEEEEVPLPPNTHLNIAQRPQLGRQ